MLFISRYAVVRDTPRALATAFASSSRFTAEPQPLALFFEPSL
jgi:hypothetical protein